MSENSTAAAPGYRYQITGRMATGFRVMDTWTDTLIDHCIERVDANTAVADANRAWYRKNIEARPAGRRRAHIGNSQAAAAMIDPLFGLGHLEAARRRETN